MRLLLTRPSVGLAMKCTTIINAQLQVSIIYTCTTDPVCNVISSRLLAELFD